MTTSINVTCPKKGCGEDRPTLIHKIEDKLGPRYVCMVCSHEFKVLNSQPIPGKS